MAAGQTIGRVGEELAVRYLKKKGWQILDRNFEFRISGRKKGEIDIIAREKKTIVFIEVKTTARLNTAFNPEEKINFKKHRSLLKAAELWLLKNKFSLDYAYRIDIIIVQLERESRKTKIIHYPNALGNL